MWKSNEVKGIFKRAYEASQRGKALSVSVIFVGYIKDTSLFKISLSLGVLTVTTEEPRRPSYTTTKIEHTRQSSILNMRRRRRFRLKYLLKCSRGQLLKQHKYAVTLISNLDVAETT